MNFIRSTGHGSLVMAVIAGTLVMMVLLARLVAEIVMYGADMLFR